MFEPLRDMHADSCKYNPICPVGICNINTTTNNIVPNLNIKY